MLKSVTNSDSHDMTDQAASLRKLASPCRVIGLISSQVGLGYGTILASVAAEIAKQTDWKTLLFCQRQFHKYDNRLSVLNILGGGLDSSQTIADLPFDAHLISSRYDNLDIFHLSEDAALLSPEAVDQIHKLEVKLKEITQNYQLVLLDFGQMVEDETFVPMALPSELITITSPSKDSRARCYGLIKDILKNEAHPQINLIVNMAPSPIVAENVAESVQSVVKKFLNHDLQILGKFLADPDVIRATRQNQPITEISSDNLVAEPIQEVVRELLNNHDQNKTTLVKLGTLLVQNFIASSKN
jgi:flagellar biosynthesis protein FlhG